MNFIFYCIVGFVLLFSIEKARAIKQYDNYDLYHVNATYDEDMSHLQDLKEFHSDIFDFWHGPLTESGATIMVNKKFGRFARELFENRSLEFDLISTNVQRLLDSVQDSFMHESEPFEVTLDWQQYHTIDVINNWMDALAKKHRGLVKVMNIGQTNENRNIRLLHISAKKEESDEEQQTRPSVFIDGGIHAREWITPAVVTYITNELLTTHKDSSLVQNMDWYLLPVLNPDGYDYSHTFDRLWRKNRSRSTSNARGSCMGVDLNRNFGYHWGNSGGGYSPCAETYRGPGAFSERESKAIEDFIKPRQQSIKLYISMHSYSQIIFTPWSYTVDTPQDYNDLFDLGEKAAAALKNVSGTKYTVGTPSKLMYKVAGSSMDWAKGSAGIKYSYVFELRDTGRYGFLLPAKEIVPTAKETFAAVRLMAEHVMNEHQESADVTDDGNITGSF